MSERDPSGRAPLKVESGEPSATGADSRVPDVDAWVSAADRGAAARAARTPGRRVPSWTPASAGIPGYVLRQLIDWARSGLPNEACGLLAASRTAEDGGIPTRFIGLRNAASSPFRYLIDPDEQLGAMLDIDDRDEIIWGIFHSHVASRPEPSATDVGLAFYPDALYLICSLAEKPPVIRAWSIVEGQVGEVVLEVV